MKEARADKEMLYSEAVVALQKLAPLFWEPGGFVEAESLEYPPVATKVYSMLESDVTTNLLGAAARPTGDTKTQLKSLYNRIIIKMKNASECAF